MKTKKSTKIAINVILAIMAFIWLAPLLFVVLNLVKTKQEYNLGSFWKLPEGFYLLSNIKSVVETGLFQAVGSSFLYAVTGAVCSVSIGLLAAYGLSHLRIRGKLFWFMFIYSGTVFPFQIYLIPVYKGYFTVGLYNTRIGMILFYTAICIPFCMFVLRNFFLGISGEIRESAKIDGATNWKTLMSIFVPMAKAPMSILLLSQFTWCWNDLMFGLTFTKNESIRPIMATISMLGRGNAPVLFLACLIASVPTIVLFFLLQNNFEAGMVYTTK